MLSEILKRAPQGFPQMAPQMMMPNMPQAPQMDVFGQTQNSGMLSQALRGLYGGFNRFRPY